MTDPDRRALVLYVDDELSNRVVFEQSFADQFRIATADSGARALEMMADEQAAVVVSDQRMPDMPGTELLAVLRERYPDTVRIILTAYSDPEPILDAVNKAGASRYLVKPWDRREMGAVLSGALESFELQREMRKLQLQLVDLQQLSSLGTLLSSIAHDMASPLTAILANCERLNAHATALAGLLGQGGDGTPVALTPGVRDAAEELTPIARETSESAKYLNELVLGIRTHSRPISAESEADSRSTLLFAASLMRSIASESRVRLVLPEGPLPRVKISPTSLCQLFINLLTNAVQAFRSREAGVVSIGVREENGRVEFQVKDSGPGIPKALLERLGRERVTTKSEAEGTGLGLMICRDLVQRAGGTFRVESIEGVGTTVTFRLMAAQAGSRLPAL